MIRRKDYPALRQYTYLNTPAFGLLSEKQMEWRQEHDLDYMLGGSTMKIPAMKLLRTTRELLAEVYHADVSRISLVPNFSLGLNLILEGAPEQLHVLLVEGDYPSLNWPFEDRGFHCSRIPLSTDLETRIEEALDTEAIDVLALSLVQWVDGLRIRPGFLAELKERYPNLMIIADGTQYLGAFSLNFEESGIDVLGGSGYKWLLGGTGTGFFFFSKEVLERWNWPSTGFNAAGVSHEGRGDMDLPHRLMPGHLDTLCFGTLAENLELLRGGGQERVEHYNRELCAKVSSALLGLGLWDEEYARRDVHGTIFNIPGDEKLFQRLMSEGIIGSLRGEGIRLGFHAYNNEDDLEHLLQVLRSSRK